jgi:hypothetical protein
MSLRDGKDLVAFAVLDKVNKKFKVLGMRNYDLHNHEIVDPPAPLVKDEIVTLVKGPFQLWDYKDTSNHKAHTYVLKKADGTLIEGILDSFTHDCTYQCSRDIGIPQLDVLIPKNTTTTTTATTSSS